VSRKGYGTITDPEGEEWVMGPGGSLHRPCPPDCVDGYRFVTDLYAVSIADPDEDPGKHAAALNSVYPCSTCNAEVARLWGAGHMHPDHVTAGGCEECKPRPTTKRKS
jgi:hypothetical protein